MLDEHNISAVASYVTAGGGLAACTAMFWMWFKARLSKTDKEVSTNKAESQLIKTLEIENNTLRDRVNDAEKHYNAAVSRLAIVDQQQQKIDELQKIVSNFTNKLEEAYKMIQKLSVENATLTVHIRHIEEQNTDFKLQISNIEQQNSRMYSLLSSLERKES